MTANVSTVQISLATSCGTTTSHDSTSAANGGYVKPSPFTVGCSYTQE